MGGYIKLYRQIQDSWIWDNPTHLKWWLDIIFMANHCKKRKEIAGKIVEFEAGEFHTSQLKLSQKWGVSVKTVRRFLNLLEDEKMVIQTKKNKGTTIKVSNYLAFQSVSEDEVPTRMPIEMPFTVPTNKNVRNIYIKYPGNSCEGQQDNSQLKNGKDESETMKTAKLASEYMAKKILQTTPDYFHLREDRREKTLANWARDIDKLLRLDKVDPDVFKLVLEFSQTDPFWSGNIQSGKKFREQFWTMLHQANKRGR